MPKNLTLILLTLLTFSIAAESRAEPIIDDTADILPLGIAEQAYQEAFKNLAGFINFYLQQQKDDFFSEKDTNRFLQKEHEHLYFSAHQTLPGPKIVFRSEKKRPGFFFLDGQTRVAKTGGTPNEDHWGQVIYINQDMIRSNADLADLSQAASTLIHELGHQLGFSDHDWLDHIGAMVKTNSDRYRESTKLMSPYDPGARIVVYNFSNVYQAHGEPYDAIDNARVYFIDSLGMRDLSEKFYQVACPELYNEGQPIKRFPRRLSLGNLHNGVVGSWSLASTSESMSKEEPDYLQNNPSFIRVNPETFEGQLKFACEKAGDYRGEYHDNYNLEITLNMKDPKEWEGQLGFVSNPKISLDKPMFHLIQCAPYGCRN